MKADISTFEDIQVLVNTFYDKVRKDDLIGGIFAGVITDWEPHLQKMYRFWQSILLGENTYNGRPFPPHAQMRLQQQHFDRWLKLWHETLDDKFSGPVADEAKMRAKNIANIFVSKISYFTQSNP
ncbi:group III truncated hemoglobin [Polluticaenibacter yanchengensis]|uniref:Group III truncated hemoglobin n=1 Tax=Polluticaenibacter yanchengensis TaxID=3014562 RepID=A0ABT4UJW6_9BACT|nr:group III truncated hemoglobin [Chitinophagaceae bacterium LY-5]